VRRAASSCLFALLFVASSAHAEDLRYFGVWSYAENRPAEEIPAERLAQRDLGYWALEFDDAGRVLRGTYHGSSGAVWLRLEYVEQDGRVFADLFAADGRYVTRKSTGLRSLVPTEPPPQRSP
jgi:hypothetical protein